MHPWNFSRSIPTLLGLIGLSVTLLMLACSSTQEGASNGGDIGTETPCTSSPRSLPFQDRFGPGEIVLDACPGPNKQAFFSLQRANCEAGECPTYELGLGQTGRSLGLMGLVDILSANGQRQTLGHDQPPLPSPLVIPEEMRWPVLVLLSTGQFGSHGIERSTLNFVSLRYREPTALGVVPYSASNPTGGGFSTLEMAFEPPPPDARTPQEGSNPEAVWQFIMRTHALPNRGDSQYRPGAPQREVYELRSTFHRTR